MYRIEAREKMKTFAKDILQQCQDKGFTVCEMSILCDELNARKSRCVANLEQETKFKVLPSE